MGDSKAIFHLLLQLFVLRDRHRPEFADLQYQRHILVARLVGIAHTGGEDKIGTLRTHKDYTQERTRAIILFIDFGFEVSFCKLTTEKLRAILPQDAYTDRIVVIVVTAVRSLGQTLISMALDLDSLDSADPAYLARHGIVAHHTRSLRYYDFLNLAHGLHLFLLLAAKTQHHCQ